jgi:queuosine precursor transporter
MATLSVVFAVGLVLANIVGCRLVQFGDVVFSAGMLVFPVTFVVTDVVHERYGRPAVIRMTLLGLASTLAAAVLFMACGDLPIPGFAPVPDAAFDTVLVASARVTLASVVAYCLSQATDIAVFAAANRVAPGALWLRATGSTLVSQSVDTAAFVLVAFWGSVPTPVLWAMAATMWTIKVAFATASTPLLYLARSCRT